MLHVTPALVTMTVYGAAAIAFVGALQMFLFMPRDLAVEEPIQPKKEV